MSTRRQEVDFEPVFERMAERAKQKRKPLRRSSVAIWRAVGQLHVATIYELAQLTELHYRTVWELLQELIETGYVCRELGPVRSGKPGRRKHYFRLLRPH